MSALILILLSSHVAVAAEDNLYIVNTRNAGLRVRNKAALQGSATIGSLPKSTVVKVLATEGDWLKISAPGLNCAEPGNSCYAYKSYLKKVTQEDVPAIIQRGTESLSSNCNGSQCNTATRETETPSTEAMTARTIESSPPLGPPRVFAPICMDTKGASSTTSATLAETVRSRTFYLTASQKECEASCPQQDSADMRSVCARFQKCQDNCVTSRITLARACRANGKNFDKTCISPQLNCSPFSGIAEGQERKDVLLKMLEQDWREILNTSRWAGHRALQAQASILPKMFLCLNTEFENIELEPINRINSDCGSTDFGIGQVNRGSFFDVLGLNVDTGDHSGKDPVVAICGNKKLSDLQANGCDIGGRRRISVVAQNRMRWELFAGTPYEHMTPLQIYDRLAFDVDLQIKFMLGVWLNHLADRKTPNAAWTGYFGGSRPGRVAEITACAKPRRTSTPRGKSK